MIEIAMIPDRVFLMFKTPFIQPDLLWIIVPIYINWIINDIFTDKVPDFVNFVSGGFTALWIGMTLGRDLTMAATSDTLTTLSSLQGIVVIFLIVFGLVIVIEAARKKEIVKYIARTREITYLLLWLVPLFFNIIPANIDTLIAALIFFPIFYIIIEFIDRFIIKSEIG